MYSKLKKAQMHNVNNGRSRLLMCGRPMSSAFFRAGDSVYCLLDIPAYLRMFCIFVTCWRSILSTFCASAFVWRTKVQRHNKISISWRGRQHKGISRLIRPIAYQYMLFGIRFFVSVSMEFEYFHLYILLTAFQIRLINIFSVSGSDFF